MVAILGQKSVHVLNLGAAQLQWRRVVSEGFSGVSEAKTRGIVPSKDYYVMKTNAVWKILRWKTEAVGINEMGPKRRSCFSVVGLCHLGWYDPMKLVSILTSVNAKNSVENCRASKRDLHVLNMFHPSSLNSFPLLPFSYSVASTLQLSNTSIGTTISPTDPFHLQRDSPDCSASHCLRVLSTECTTGTKRPLIDKVRHGRAYPRNSGGCLSDNSTRAVGKGR